MTRHGHLRRIILGAGALAACCAAARAQDPNAAALEVFQSLYGEQVRAVQATGKSDDDVELAGKLLSAARQAEANAALRALLCEKAHDLAHNSRPGYPVAVEAMTLLAETLPAKARGCWEKALNLLQRRYNGAGGFPRLEAGEYFVIVAVQRAERVAAGGDYDEAMDVLRKAQPVAVAVRSADALTVLAMQKHYVSRAAVARRAAALEGALKARPADRASRAALIFLLAIELDRPARAAELIDAETDEATRTYLPLAARDVAKLDPAVCLELGDWYRSCALKPSLSNDGKAIAWRRAAEYYQAFLDRGGGEEMKKMKARLALADLEKSLRAAGGASWPPGRRPGPLPAETLAYARARNRLPPKIQVEVLEHKLLETNGGKKIPFTFDIAGPQVTGASVSGCASLVSLEALAGLPLTSLSVRSCAGLTGDLWPLAAMPLKNLRIGGCTGLTSLHGLAGAPLTSIDLGGCTHLTSLAALRGAPLKTLELTDMTSLASLHGLEGAPLTGLSISNCPKLKDLSGLKGSKITSLDIHRCAALEGLDGIQELPLTRFAIRQCHNVRSLAPLKGFGAKLGMTSLDLSGYAKLESLAGLEGVPLKRLDISDCRSLAGDLSVLKDARLADLDLSGCPKLRSLRGLEGQPLKAIALRRCPSLAGDLTPLKDSGVTALNLSGCTSIESLKGIEGLKLTSLNVAGCEKLTAEDFERIKRIRTLKSVSTGNYRRDAELMKAIEGSRGK